MYIEPNTLIDPNRINGQFYENMNFTGDEFMGYVPDTLMNYENVSPEIEEDLMRIHNEIEEDLQEVAAAKVELETINNLIENYVFVDNWTALINGRNNGTLPNTHALHIEIELARAAKDASRMEYSRLTGEQSRLNTRIQAREMGSIFGLKQEFKDKAGFEYIAPPSPEPVVTVNNGVVNDGIDSVVSGRNNLISTISDTTGLNKQQSKYLLYGAAAFGIILLIKKNK